MEVLVLQLKSFLQVTGCHAEETRQLVKRPLPALVFWVLGDSPTLRIEPEDAGEDQGESECAFLGCRGYHQLSEERDLFDHGQHRQGQSQLHIVLFSVASHRRG